MNKHRKFENKITSLLDQSVDEVSPEIARRLQQSRYAALEKPRSRWYRMRMPITAMAAVFIAVVITSIWFDKPDNVLPETVLAMETEMEVLSSTDNLELMEDLDFIQWLVETEGYAS